jgi:hypothetical protein
MSGFMAHDPYHNVCFLIFVHLSGAPPSWIGIAAFIESRKFVPGTTQ